jgi:hypothetical protein
VPNPEESNFCASCGKPLASIDTPSPAPTPVERDVALTERARQRQQRALRIVAIFVVAVLVVAGGLTYALRNVHIEIDTNRLVTVRLPIDVCKTTVGDRSEVPVGLPSTIHVKIPKVDSGTLAFYSDNEGILGVLAPTGWNCAATIGADGSSSLNVFPTGQDRLAIGALGAGSTAETISAQQTSACVGCRIALACPLFTISANDSGSEMNQPCTLTRPTSEKTTLINEHVVEFTDPPGIHGDADPSGGAYPAMGVMTYYGDRASQGSWTETCLLPPTEKATCKAIIANFESRYRSF